MRDGLVAPALVLTVLLAGCAGAACAPATIVVARKEERSQLRGEPRGMRTDERGGVEEVQRQVITTQYWVADGDGRWYRVDEAAWRTVRLGQPIAVCR